MGLSSRVRDVWSRKVLGQTVLKLPKPKIIPSAAPLDRLDQDCDHPINSPTRHASNTPCKSTSPGERRVLGVPRQQPREVPPVVRPLSPGGVAPSQKVGQAGLGLGEPVLAVLNHLLPSMGLSRAPRRNCSIIFPGIALKLRSW